MPVFAVRTAKGDSWDDGRAIREQAFWPEHAAFADLLVEKGVIILGGPVDSDDPDDIALLAVEAADEAAARAAFGPDPWLVHGIFRLKEIRRWTIWLDGRNPAAPAGQGG
jgi:uncharacterized protein YciI